MFKINKENIITFILIELAGLCVISCGIIMLCIYSGIEAFLGIAYLICGLAICGIGCNAFIKKYKIKKDVNSYMAETNKTLETTKICELFLKTEVKKMMKAELDNLKKELKLREDLIKTDFKGNVKNKKMLKELKEDKLLDFIKEQIINYDFENLYAMVNTIKGYEEKEKMIAFYGEKEK